MNEIIMEKLEIAKIHLDRLKKAASEIKKKNLLEHLGDEEFEIIKTIDTFIFRFSKLQDYLGQKLLKTFLDVIGEYDESMSLVDVLDKLEKLRVIDSSYEWIKIRKIRNRLTHEYPNNLRKTKEEIELALKQIDLLENTVSSKERKII